MIADASWIYVIVLRWAHVVCAGLLIGGTFFVAFLLPPQSDTAELSATDSLYLRSRRGYKRVVHTCILLLLISGIYNFYGNRGLYDLNPPLMHSLFGIHLLLGLIVFAILLVVLARRTWVVREWTWLRVAVVVLFLTALVASSLKYVRDHIRM